MPNLTEALTLEKRIFDILGLGDGISDLSRAKMDIQRIAAAKYETRQQISDEVDAHLPRPAIEQVPTIDEYVNAPEDTLLQEAGYTLPQRGALGRLFRSGHDERQKQAAIERAKAARSTAYNAHVTQIEERLEGYNNYRWQEINARGHSKESLRQDAEWLLTDLISQNPFAFRGSGFKPYDIDEARFLREYIDFKQQIGQKNFRNAVVPLDAGLSIINQSVHPQLHFLRDDVILEQARTFIDAGQYNLAVEVSTKVDDWSVNGEASYLKGEAYLRAGSFNLAAIEFRNSYTINPHRADISDKIVVVVKGQISDGNIAQASSFLSEMIEASKNSTIPFTQETKDRMLLEQGRALMETGPANYDAAYQVANTVNDESSQGQASYLRGQISFRRAGIAQSIDDLLDAERNYRNAFVRNPDIMELKTALSAAYTRLEELTPDRNNNFGQINPEVAAKYQEASKLFEHGIVSDRPDGSAGAKKLFGMVLESLGYAADIAQPASNQPVDYDTSKIQAVGRELEFFEDQHKYNSSFINAAADAKALDHNFEGVIYMASRRDRYEPALKSQYALLAEAGVPQDKLAPISAAMDEIGDSLGKWESAVKEAKANYEQRQKPAAGGFDAQFNAAKQELEALVRQPVDSHTLADIRQISKEHEASFYEALTLHDAEKLKLNESQETLSKLNPETPASEIDALRQEINASEQMINFLSEQMDASNKVYSAAERFYKVAAGGAAKALNAGAESKDQLESAIFAASKPYMDGISEKFGQLRKSYNAAAEYVAREQAAAEARNQEEIALGPYGILMKDVRRGLEPMLAKLNEAERLLLAKTLHQMARISRFENNLHESIGFNRTNPPNIGYIGQSLAVIPTKQAYAFLGEQLTVAKNL